MKKGFMKSKGGKVLYWCLMGMLIAVFLTAAFMVARHYYDEQKSAGQFDDLAQMTQKEPQQAASQEPTAAEKYASVLAENDDFIGWIKIPETRIDYPVVQTPDSPNYYLRRGFDKKYSYYGVPYAAEICTIGDCDNTIIYGHNMTNGSMFSDLQKYSSKEFWQGHRYVQFDTMEGFGVYEIFAVIKTAAGAKNEFKYYKFAEGDAQAFADYVAECKHRSLYDTGITAEKGDRLLTLSTCEYSRDNGRMAVIAKKIN